MTATLSKRVSQLTTTVQGLRARHEAIGSQLAVARKTMVELETKKAHLIKCTGVLDKLTQEVARKGVGRVEQAVTPTARKFAVRYSQRQRRMRRERPSA